jgi:outer membrane protein TolC
MHFLVIAQTEDSSLYLPELVQEAMESNPQLQSLYNAWQAGKARIPQAGALPDPTLSFNLLNVPVETFVFDQEPMTGKQISLTQNFPFPGKLGLRENIASHGARIFEMHYKEMSIQIVKQVKMTFFELFYVDKSIETSENNKELLKQFIGIAETRYKVGKGIQQDVIKAQVEYARIEDRLIMLQQRRENLESKLNQLLNRPVNGPIGKTENLEFNTIYLDFDSIKANIDKYRPLLKSWQEAIKQSEQKRKLAEKGYLPDFKFGVAYTQREELVSGGKGIDFFSAMMNLQIPLYFWKKQKKNIEENKYSEISTRSRYENIRQQEYQKLDQILANLNKNKRRVALYKNNIIPLASQSLNSAISAYQVNEVDFLTLTNNQMTLFNDELEYFRALSDYHQNLAELEATVGIPTNNTGIE